MIPRPLSPYRSNDPCLDMCAEMTDAESDSLSADVVATLRDTGVLDAFVPEQYGGARQTIAFIAGRIGQVAGWNAEAGSLAARTAVNNFAVSEFARPAQDDVWGTTRDALVGMARAPFGSYARTGDTVVVDWESRVESDSSHATWLLATVGRSRSTDRAKVLVPVGDLRSDAAGSGLTHAVAPVWRIRELGSAATEAPLEFLTVLFQTASVVGTARAACLGVSRSLDDPAVSGWNPWAEPGRHATFTSAMHRMDRAESLLRGALSMTESLFRPEALSPDLRSRAAVLATDAMEDAQLVIPSLIGSLGTATPVHTGRLVHSQRIISMGAGHPAFSASRASTRRELPVG